MLSYCMRVKKLEVAMRYVSGDFCGTWKGMVL